MEKAVTRRKWTAGLLITGTVALVVAFWSLIMSMLSLLAVAGVLTLLSLPLCKVLEKRLPGGAAAAIALLTLLGAVLGMLWGLIPPLLRQSAQLMSRLPALLDSLRELLTRWSAALEARGIPLGDMQAELFSRISAAAGQLAATLVSGIRRLTGSVSQWLLAPLLSFYFLRDRKRFCLLLSLVLPVKYRARGIRAAREMRRESALYLRGQLILSLFVAAMTALALLLTRTPGALLLGLFMGVMELIPYIGPLRAFRRCCWRCKAAGRQRCGRCWQSALCSRWKRTCSPRVCSPARRGCIHWRCCWRLLSAAWRAAWSE